MTISDIFQLLLHEKMEPYLLSSVETADISAFSCDCATTCVSTT